MLKTTTEYNTNLCGFYDNILDKDTKGMLVVKKYFVPHQEVIDFFHEKYHIPTIEKLSFHLAHVRIFGSMECGKTINDYFHGNAQKYIYEAKKVMQKH